MDIKDVAAQAMEKGTDVAQGVGGDALDKVKDAAGGAGGFLGKLMDKAETLTGIDLNKDGMIGSAVVTETEETAAEGTE